MTLTEAIAAAGLTPPPRITPGRWMRFPGIGKGKANRAGWCRLITPTLAIFGDWSSNVTVTWRDDSHRDDENTARLLAQARAREAAYAAEQKAQQRAAADKAQTIICEAITRKHRYLERKGFPARTGLVHETKLVIPVRDVADYARVISVQFIAENGEKRFLPGGRARGGIHRIGCDPMRAKRLALVEGYATGLSIDAALQRLPGPHAVIVCFSARNMQLVAESFPRAIVCADNDESKTGEEAAKATGLPWSMPPDVGTDFNDLHRSSGLHAVLEVLRAMPS
jgi:putative DNA primase/helicase